MKKIILIFFSFFTIYTYSQCFDCAKNYGSWIDDSIKSICVDTNNDVYLSYTDYVAGNFSTLTKHDSNCNIIWSKKFTNVVYIGEIVTDEYNNLYVLFYFDYSLNNNYGPFLSNGLNFYTGLNVFKFDSSGNYIWSKSIRGIGGTSNIMEKIFKINNEIIVTGTFSQNLIIDGQLQFTLPYTNSPRAFIAKYDLSGNFINVNYYGDGNDDFIDSEVDNYGNIYLSKQRQNSNGVLGSSNILKINNINLNLLMNIELSNRSNGNSLYKPTTLHFNHFNQKLYVWGAFNETVNVMNNIFSINGFNSIFQSLLCEIDVSNGSLTQIKRFDNSSNDNLAYVLGSVTGTTGYLASYQNNLYILTSYKGNMNFSNQSITSASYLVGGATYYAEDLVLFKINLSNFNDEFIFKSINLSNNINSFNYDYAGPITFNNDDLYITSTFTSKPIDINGTVINNNSGNKNSDVLLYKFNINNVNLGQIILDNTCLNNNTQFNLNGNFNSIVWNFGDPSSSNNSATGINNPTHQYSNIGTYQVTATVTCQGNTQTIQKEVIITNTPIINSISNIIQCETIVGSGVSSNFDTSFINNQLIGNQQNVTVEYRNSNNQLLTSPLPNPYTNTISGGDTITARVFNDTNPDCFVETQINFIVNPKPNPPTVTSPQTFCFQDNATISNIVITGQNITWYDAQTNGNILPITTALQNGVTYYATQTINGCESDRIAVSVNIQNTPAPTGSATQTFCSTQNASLNDISLNGTNIIWYTDNTSTTALSNSTVLLDNTSYFATQIVNGCESPTRFEVLIDLINTLNALDYQETLCDDLNDGFEIINLTSFNSNLITTTGNSFSYYTSLNGAENQISSAQINNVSNYNLNIGTTTIFVRINSQNGCHQVVELKLTLVSKPRIAISDIMPICEGTSITINAGNGFDSYNWSTGATTQSILISQAGNYSVTVTENHNGISCSSTKNFTVVNSNAATVSEIITSDWTDNNNTITVLISNSSVGNYVYSLDGINYQNSNVFYGLESGEHTVFVKDTNGCGISNEEVYLLMYPKYFTPNGDSYNDTWKIKFSQKEPNLKVAIFDRYGKLLKMMNSFDAWDGKSNGKDLPSDDYWFVVTRQNGKEFRGHFAMKR